MTTVTLAKWGNSVGIRIPAALIKAAHLHPGKTLEIITHENEQLTLAPVLDPQASWLDPFNKIVDIEPDEELKPFDPSSTPKYFL